MTEPTNKDNQPASQPSGQPIGGAWAQQQKKGMEKQQGQKAPTRDLPKAQGDHPQGGAGDAHATPREPEKQGGIGGP
jgi:hypothetical protein